MSRRKLPPEMKGYHAACCFAAQAHMSGKTPRDIMEAVPATSPRPTITEAEDLIILGLQLKDLGKRNWSKAVTEYALSVVRRRELEVAAVGVRGITTGRPTAATDERPRVPPTDQPGRMLGFYIARFGSTTKIERLLREDNGHLMLVVLFTSGEHHGQRHVVSLAVGPGGLSCDLALYVPPIL